LKPTPNSEPSLPLSALTRRATVWPVPAAHGLAAAIHLEEGSGISRNNDFTARGLAKVLVPDHRRLDSRGLKIAAGSVDDGMKRKGKLMAAQGRPTVRKERSRRTTGHDALTTVRLSSELRERVDAWGAKQRDKPARPEAILRLVELGLETTHRSESLTSRAEKASEMAAQEIDRLTDPSATDEERQLRKRRLIKGPKEFRDIRKQAPGD
jgi:hypothetical protein